MNRKICLTIKRPGFPLKGRKVSLKKKGGGGRGEGERGGGEKGGGGEGGGGGGRREEGEAKGEESSGGNKGFTISPCSILTDYNEVIHFELTGVDSSKLPEDCVWQTQRKSFVLQLAVKLGNNYPFADEHR